MYIKPKLFKRFPWPGLQSGRRQRSPPSPSQGPCVSLGFFLFSFVWACFSFVFTWISESVFLLSVSLGSGVTVHSEHTNKD